MLDLATEGHLVLIHNSERNIEDSSSFNYCKAFEEISFIKSEKSKFCCMGCYFDIDLVFIFIILKLIDVLLRSKFESMYMGS